jgi:hypothetical protein
MAPLKEPWWDLVDALVWVVYRDPEKIRQNCDPVDKLLDDRRRAALVRQDRGEEIGGLGVSVYEHPATVSWFSTDEKIARARAELWTAITTGEICISGRKRSGAPRTIIASLELTDMRVDFTNETSLLVDADELIAPTVRAAWRSLRVRVEDLLRVFPPHKPAKEPEPEPAIEPEKEAAAEPEPDPATPVYSFDALVEFVRASPRRDENAMRTAATGHFRLPIPRKIVRAAIKDAGVKNPPGRPRATA